MLELSIPVICRRNTVQNTTVKAIHFNIQASGQNRQQVKRHGFSGRTLSHRRFHHTDTSSLLQMSHQSPLFGVKRAVMLSLASSGNSSQRRRPVPLCSQSSCSIRQFRSSRSTPSCRCVSQRVNAIFSGDTTPRPAAVRATEWQMKREMLSPAYTTRWNELPVARL